MSGVVLRVDETVIYATDMGAAYWSKWRQAHRPDRFRVIAANPMGETVEVECDGREHAEWLRDFLAGKGVPSRAMRLTRPTPAPDRLRALEAALDHAEKNLGVIALTLTDHPEYPMKAADVDAARSLARFTAQDIRAARDLLADGERSDG